MQVWVTRDDDTVDSALPPGSWLCIGCERVFPADTPKFEDDRTEERARLGHDICVDCSR